MKTLCIPRLKRCLNLLKRVKRSRRKPGRLCCCEEQVGLSLLLDASWSVSPREGLHLSGHHLRCAMKHVALPVHLSACRGGGEPWLYNETDDHQPLSWLNVVSSAKLVTNQGRLQNALNHQCSETSKLWHEICASYIIVWPWTSNLTSLQNNYFLGLLFAGNIWNCIQKYLA